jgi:HTH-type transcriptional regulator/antitoxin HigA
MTELGAPFAPDWVSPPGDTILDLIEERGWTQTELASRLGYTEKHISQLINGKVSLTDEVALCLERVLGSNAGFWLAREAKYREHSARLEAAKIQAGWINWLDELPLKELMDSEVITKRRNVVNQKLLIVNDCLRFFGVASPKEWQTYYGGMEASFRRSRVEQSNIGAISTWLRLGERKAELLDLPKYDKQRFEKILKVIRDLTIEEPKVFEPRMRELLREAGVAFVLVPAIPCAHVSGVARWLSPTKPLIQMSLYGKTNDKFWFTFFHEAAHILLHADTKEDKKSVFLDDPNSNHVNNPQEHEANQWAGNWLIPEQYAELLSSLQSKSKVTDFAKQIGIHAGIVVGRLQHDGLIDPSWMNGLKQRFQFKKAGKQAK